MAKPWPLPTSTRRSQAGGLLGEGCLGQSRLRQSLMGFFYCLLQNLSPEELEGLKTSLAQHFMEGSGKTSGVTCLYFVEEGQR